MLSLISLAPIDVERRIVDEVAAGGPIRTIVWLGVFYLAFQGLQQVMKLSLGVFQDWVAAALAANCRRDALDTHWRLGDGGRRGDPAHEGMAVEVVAQETDNLMQFVGTGFSDAIADLVLFFGIVIYMLAIQPQIALLSFVFFLPQIVLAPWIQGRLNRLNSHRVRMIRDLSGKVGERADAGAEPLLRSISRNQVMISLVQHALKAMRNLLIALPTVTVLVFGGLLVMRGQASMGTVVAFVSGFRKIADPFRGLLDFYVNVEKARVQHNLIARWFERETREQEVRP